MAAEPSPVTKRTSAAASVPELATALGALRARWWVVALAIAAALAAAALVTAGQERRYRASTTLVVGPAPAIEAAADILRTLETLERRSVIATFARIPGSPECRRVVAAKLGLAALDGWRIEGSVLPNTNIIRVDVEGPDPARAAQVANLAAEATRDEAQALYRIFTMRTLAQAVPPREASQPDVRRNLLLAAVAGLVAGAAGAYVLERRTARAPRD